MSDDLTRQEAIDGLRAFADFLEQHPDSALPAAGDLYICDYQYSRDGLTKRARDLGGRWDKREGDTYFNLIRRFGPVEYSIYTNREQVCERVVVGTEEVEVPDPDVEVPMVTKTVEKVEWRCADSLLREAV